MQKFKDCKNREWAIELNMTAKKHLREETGVDLFALCDDETKLIGTLLEDGEKLVGVLYVLCEKQCLAADPVVTEEDFGEGMAGDALWNAGQAFVEEWINFLPDRRKREALRQVIAKEQEVRTATAALVTTRLGAIDANAKAAELINHFERRIMNGSPGSVPASSESIRVAGPGGN